MFIDYMGKAVETGCKSLDQKLNSHLCYGGGGGGNTTTSTQSIDPDIKARILPALDMATAQFKKEQADPYATVAGSAEVEKALGKQEALANQVYSGGLGTQNLLNELENTRGKQLAAGQSTLGSARADRARAAGMQDQAMKLQQADLDARSRAAESMTGIAGAQRGITQELLDAPHKSTQRYFGYLGSAADNSDKTTQQSGGGGK